MRGICSALILLDCVTRVLVGRECRTHGRVDFLVCLASGCCDRSPARCDLLRGAHELVEVGGWLDAVGQVEVSGELC